MNAGPNVAEIAALIGDPARANIMTALSGGEALTATELAYAAGVTPQTTSAHLAKLVAGGLLAVAAQGRHRYFRLAGQEVAHLLETMMVVAADRAPPKRRLGRRTAAIRDGRTCYDHLAGRLGVALTDALLEKRWLAPTEKDFRVTEAGIAGLTAFGIDLAAVRDKRRAFARQCLDWSERRPHLAGALGAAVAGRCFDLGWIRRAREGRGVEVTGPGRELFRVRFGMTL